MQATSSRRASGLSILVLNNREEFSGATVIANMDHPYVSRCPFLHDMIVRAASLRVCTVTYVVARQARDLQPDRCMARF
jgi:hypothetical protein